ncbi:DUF645 family protein [Vibrio vulnificus]|nr:DUF645 family protein [Vibrio vulnificus]
MLLDVPFGKFGFTKGCIITVILHSLSWTLNRGQLNLECFEIWLPTSQLLALDGVCVMLFRKIVFKQRCLKVIGKQ